MAFCSNCGADVQDKFCSRCGAANPLFSAGAAAGVPLPPPPPPPAGAAAGELPENLACALAYAFGPLSGVLLLVLEPYSVNMRIRFHAMQSLFVSGTIFILWFALLLVSAILLIVPLAGAILGSLLLAIFGLAVLALWVKLMVSAYQGQMWKVPYLGDLAEKQAYSK